jgi:ribonuclease BN (tRNA processing enzyme)
MIDFINVGYGDSVLIREMQDDGQIFSMLIDCGDVTTGTSEGESKRIKAADFLHKEGVNKLDLLVITHLHLDHVGGFVHMLSDIQISELWCNYLPEKKYWGREVQQSEYLSCGARSLLTSLNIYSKALYQLANKGTKILCIQSNRKTLSLGEALQMEVFCEKTELYHQQEKIWNRAFEGCVSSDELDRLDLFINNTSLRMRLGYAGKEIELPGDICASSWERHHISKCAILK